MNIEVIKIATFVLLGIAVLLLIIASKRKD